MTRSVSLSAIVLLSFSLIGCGETKPTPVPTDPDSVKKLEELQKQASKGEK